MEPNLAVSIYIRSSIKFLHFVPFHQQIWPPRAILASDGLLFKQIFSSETAWQNGAKLGRKHLCKILYKASSFGSNRPTNMTAKINYFFWLANAKKSSPLKQLGQMETNLEGSIYVRCPYLAYIVHGCVPFKIVSNSPSLHSRWLLLFKVMIISLWNLLQYHYIVRWAIQAQCAEPLVKYCNNII
jgi:hypothetical protein